MKYNPIHLASIILSCTIYSAHSEVIWREISQGLEHGKALSSLYAPFDSAWIQLLRIDPFRYQIRLFNASHPQQGDALSARGWAEKEGLTAVINAAMYQTDHRRSVSFMKSADHINNPRVSGDKTVLAFDPLKKSLPQVKIIDMQCDNFSDLREHYGSMVQSIRMLSCKGNNVWQQNQRRWSIAAVGTDSSGNLLFLHVTAPHSVHEFINILRKLPINLKRAMYMEGGSQAQLFFRTDETSYEFIGNYSSGGRAFTVSSLPNVIGIIKK